MKRLSFWAAMIFSAAAMAASAATAKETVTFATYLEPAHLSAYWPLMNGKIKSNLINLQVKSLSIEAAGQAMATHQFDLFEIGALSIEDAADQGLALKMVGTGLRYKMSPLGFGIWVKADSNIKFGFGLKGKTLGSYALKSTVFTLQRYALMKKYHLNVALNGGDLNIVQLPAPSLPAALSVGRIDAATFSHLQSYQARMGHDFREAVDSGADFREVFGIPMVTSVIVAYPDKLAKRQAAYKEALRMLRASWDYTNQHKAEVFAAVSKQTGTPVSFFYDWYKNYGEFPITISKNDIAALKLVYKDAREIGASKRDMNIDDLIWKDAIEK